MYSNIKFTGKWKMILSSLSFIHTVTVKLMPGKPNLKGRLGTVDLFVPTS